VLLVAIYGLYWLEFLHIFFDKMFICDWVGEAQEILVHKTFIFFHKTSIHVL